VLKILAGLLYKGRAGIERSGATGRRPKTICSVTEVIDSAAVETSRFLDHHRPRLGLLQIGVAPRLIRAFAYFLQEAAK
jgi:hypothetical protein